MEVCKNCRKTFSAKNAEFCSTSCYNFYADALERKTTTHYKDEYDQTENLNSQIIINYNKIICNHEYSKNGTMSCRKCGHSSYT